MIEISEKPFSQREIDIVVTWLNDQELMKYSEQRHSYHTQESQLRYIHSFREPDQYKKIMAFGHFIGTVSAYIDQRHRIADVGILIGSGHTGHGHGSDAWRIFSERLAKIGVRKIEAGCMAKNRAMMRVFEKSGMRLEGTRRSHFEVDKFGLDDLVLYGMLT